MNNQKIGSFIRELRKDKGYTQKELADQLGVTDRAISKWERGLGCPDVSLLEDLARILDVSIVEILRGEKQKKNSLMESHDLIDSMRLTKENTFGRVMRVVNIIVVMLVVVFVLFIIITNAKSFLMMRRSYPLKEEGVTYVMSAEELYQKYQDGIQVILNHQGSYQDYDYQKIQSYMRIMSFRLEEQHNLKYLKMGRYSFQDLLQFYIDHGNLRTIEINNEDIYQILLKYDVSMSNNMIQYARADESISREYSNFYFYLQQPYFIRNILEYEEYLPNIYSFIVQIYDRELMLVQDIIRVGDMQ